MKKNILYATGLGFFLITTQLLYFWFVPFETEVFSLSYPFYTLVTVAHVALSYFIAQKYQYPACFAPIFCGFIVVLIQTIGTILLATLIPETRTLFFAEAVTLSVYIITMTVLLAVGIKDSVNSEEPDSPIIPFRDNPAPIPTTQRRIPKPIGGTDYHDNFDNYDM